MKVMYITHGNHWIISIESILETLKERGHEIIECVPKIWGQERIPEDVDIVLITSNADIPIIQKNTKIVFIPHGLGEECWDPLMNHYDKVLLAGKKPWTSPPDIHNWKIVGWAKSDILFNPKPEKVEYAKNLMNTLPYDKSILCIPFPDDFGPQIHFLVNYFKDRKMNMIIPYRGYLNEAKQYYRDSNHVVMPEILNLYYFVPHFKLAVCCGFTSVARELYLTKIPSIHLYHGYPESLNLSNPNTKKFNLLFSLVLDNPDAFLQPKNIVKDFIEVNDGKAVERIIKEIEGQCQ